MHISGLVSAGAMGLWHGVEYYEKEKVVGEDFYQEWNHVSVPLLNMSFYYYTCSKYIAFSFNNAKYFCRTLSTQSVKHTNNIMK